MLFVFFESIQNIKNILLCFLCKKYCALCWFTFQRNTVNTLSDEFLLLFVSSRKILLYQKWTLEGQQKYKRNNKNQDKLLTGMIWEDLRKMVFFTRFYKYRKYLHANRNLQLFITLFVNLTKLFWSTSSLKVCQIM